MTTTFRSDIAAGILSTLNACVAANPSLLKRAYAARPENVTVDLPAAFIDARPEQVTHDSGIRTRKMNPSVVIVRAWTDNPEAMAAFDALVDLLMDAFTLAPQFVLGTIWSDCTIADEEYDFGGLVLPAVRFTFQNITIMEGRT